MENYRNGHLLIVDDEPFNLEILTEYLEDAGYQVSAAEDGVEAWEALHKEGQAFDAVLLDRMMPRMNGMELLQKIKTESRFETLPVVMQTAMGAPDSVREGLLAGAYYYLTKPFERETLLAIVSAAIRDRREQRALIHELSRQRNTLTLMTRGSFAFRTIDEAHNLTAMLSSMCPNPEKTALGLSELLVNAVEHGNLGITYHEKSALVHGNRWRQEVEARLLKPDYANKQVTVEIVRLPEVLEITITDEGHGFDWHPFLDFAPERAFDPHGRGISMARMLSFDEVEYLGVGNQVKATIKLVAKSDNPQ
ncbi:DNA-binding response OmpR family regulator [Chitinivorax tropicus]|uniref:DNA-binding response OmpR family regulator n=1 Tax=Chitinivorax tropicus TaxID=714531 RepID=A0A840MEI6_9PROT|nr:response regulator [Chitinivorax tropicus]MBB5016810.1 DNA-binding response OmpR family regulator [Chitinivorax tropicus]